MKNVILFLSIIFLVSCERETSPILNSIDTNYEVLDNEIDIRAISSSAGILIIDILDCCITFRVNIVDPIEPFEIEMGDGTVLTESNLTDLGNGIYAGNYCYENDGTFIINLLPYPGKDPVQAVAEITNCKKIERCVSCNAVEITASLVTDNNGCCTYAINIMEKCESVLPNNLSLYIDGVYVLSINPSNNVSIPVSVCDGESKLIEVYSDFGLCYSKTIECGEKSCCSDLVVISQVQPIGNLCCLILFTILGDEDCMEKMTTSVSASPAPQSVTYLDNGAQVISCTPGQTVSFFIFDENGDFCKSASATSCF